MYSRLNLFCLCLLFVVLISSSCEKSNTIDDYTARPVVEGYLSAGDSISIKITKEILLGSSDTVAEPITGLKITISMDNQVIPLTASDSGIYTSPVKIVAEKMYTLKFDYSGSIITAHTTVPKLPEDYSLSVNELKITQIVFGGGGPPSGGIPTFPDPVVATWTNSDQSFYLTSYINTDTIQNPIFSGGPAFLGRGRLVFNRPTQGTNTQIESRQFQYYGLYKVYLLHVQPEYAALYENSGTSSINLAAPATNIENGLGIFTGYAGIALNLLVRKP